MQYSYILRIIIFLTMSIAQTPAVNVSIPALLAFGDSIIDAGNNNDNKITLARCNFPPYGKDFMGGIPTGRFSNGRVPTDILAEALSIKRYVPAYRDPDISPQDLLTGVTFASGAAGYDPLTSKFAGVISLTQQIELLKEYIGKVEELVGEERAKYIVANSMYLVVCGANDIASNYFSIPLTKLEYNVDSYATLMVNYASSFIQDLYNIGARRIVLFDAPPIGCVPSQRTAKGGLQRDCEENLNHLAQLFNSKLANEINLLNLKLPNSKIFIIKIYDPLFEYIQNPQKYGFEEAVKGCCGTGYFEVSIFCNRFDAVCEDNSKYLFWDGFHPTERGYELLVNTLLPQYIHLLS